MDETRIEQNKRTYLSICRQLINREGIENLLAYLEEKTDFFTAPSSSKFHLNEPGGLCLHSLNVFHLAQKLHAQVVDTIEDETLKEKAQKITAENIAISALFHDLCKTNLYKPVERYKKDNAGRWVTYPGYELDDQLPIGHGEKSCLIVHRFMKLYKEELLAIRWHMGMFDMGEQSAPMRSSFYKALDQSPLTAIIHAADFLTSNCLEVTTTY